MRMRVLNFINIIFSFIVIINSAPFSKKVIVFNKIDCKSDPEHVVFTVCEVKKPDTNPNGITTIEFDLKKKIEKSFARMETFYLKNGEYKPYIIKFDADYCSIMEKFKGSNDVLAQIVQKLSKKIDTNAFHKCPFEGHVYMRNVTVEAKDLLMFENLLQPGTYRAILNFFTTSAKDHSVATTEMEFQIKEK